MHMSRQSTKRRRECSSKAERRYCRLSRLWWLVWLCSNEAHYIIASCLQKYLSTSKPCRLQQALSFLTTMASVGHDDELRQVEDSLSQELATLSTAERMWRDKGPLLEAHGYQLRTRYQQGWTPSWLEQDLNFDYCEDSRSLPVSLVALIPPLVLTAYFQETPSDRRGTNRGWQSCVNQARRDGERGHHSGADALLRRAEGRP